jgi:hypothetical protein
VFPVRYGQTNAFLLFALSYKENMQYSLKSDIRFKCKISIGYVYENQTNYVLMFTVI